MAWTSKAVTGAAITLAMLLSGCADQGGNSTTGQQSAASDTVPPPIGKASDATRAANAALAARLPLGETSDVSDAERGFLARIEEDAIIDADGNIVWPIAAHDALQGETPDTVNPSLWRQAKLAAIHGLFEVTDGIWQVRGYDLSVMSIIRGETGWIIIDPLTTSESAAAALKLVNDTLGARPVSAVLYTHSHADHFGGVRGVIDEADAKARNIPILAPIGFTESAVAENLIAGNHMSRRATYMFGNTLPINPTGHVSSGLGPALPRGTIGVIPPTEEIEGRGTLRMVDGVVFEFVDAAGTEAPAEFMFYLPQFNALCTAEVATATFHNALTPRGAKVRDLLKWSDAIDYVLVKYGDADVVFASHHWPTWGADNVNRFLRGQRDIYRYTHDQAVRRANRGETLIELAESIPEPAVQSESFDTRGYYGTLNHNTKAVYQHYFGWWDGNPATYYTHPPVARATRMVKAMGGADKALEIGQTAYEEGDYRWAAEVLNAIVFAAPDNGPAKSWLAATYEQLGYQAESGAWRSYFLTGAQELRNGIPDVGDIQTGNRDFLAGVQSRDLFNALAARYAPEKLSRDPFLVSFAFPDTGEEITLDVGENVIVPRLSTTDDSVATLTIARSDFDRLILREVQLPALFAAGDASVEGDASALLAVFGALETPPFWFNIIEP